MKINGLLDNAKAANSIAGVVMVSGAMLPAGMAIKELTTRRSSVVSSVDHTLDIMRNYGAEDHHPINPHREWVSPPLLDRMP